MRHGAEGCGPSNVRGLGGKLFPPPLPCLRCLAPHLRTNEPRSFTFPPAAIFIINRYAAANNKKRWWLATSVEAPSAASAIDTANSHAGPANDNMLHQPLQTCR